VFAQMLKIFLLKKNMRENAWKKKLRKDTTKKEQIILIRVMEDLM
jgi:hypothetical protein